MKSIIRKFVGAALLLALPLSFTSCEDILGKWDKPIPAIPEVIALKNALDNGAQVAITYKINGNEYSATFLKEGDEYNLVSSGNPEEQMLTYDETTNRLIFSYIQDVPGGGTAPVLQVYFDIAKTSFFAINLPGFDNSFDGNLTIKGTTITIPNACPKKVLIKSSDYDLYVNYAEGETWNNVLDRYSETGHNELILFTGNLMFNYDGGMVGVHYIDPNSDTPPFAGEDVLPTDEIGKKGGAAYNDYYPAANVMAVG